MQTSGVNQQSGVHHIDTAATQQSSSTSQNHPQTMSLGQEATQQTGTSMASTSSTPLTSSSRLTGSTPGDVPLVRISMDGANAHNNTRAEAHGSQESAGSKKYEGLNTTNQALRWISSLALENTKGAVEVQATVHEGKLLISCNKNTAGLLEGLKASFQDLGKITGNERNDRHRQNISSQLLDESGFAKFKSAAATQTEKVSANDLGRQMSDAEAERVKQQVGPILDTIQNAAKALQSGDDSQINQYVKVVDSQVHPDKNKSLVEGGTKKNDEGKACMHAEQSLYDYLAKNLPSDKSEGPLLIPVAGVKRPCAVCDHVERSAASLQDSPFGESGELYLHRASNRPGVVFPGIQGISEGALGSKSNVDTTVNNLLNGQINAQSHPVINGSTDTDSEHSSSDSESEHKANY
ncbi:hypothetical protein HCH_01151 [Hahella chejuensis KCTC 2396]|uniref:Uncharacterized protein n=1 Tax=Hahella chejuensis (strain KCTC 2396) TaxID=349521 RepID=Q2SMU6_HAHCH|nr:hypothetical protein [Hahella chejuensis]ABC28028.1 hypothetical protein HCH_01151 [Hahella chejuensis KCTC 2396]